ncbi:DUF2809 domain-containing protein [Actinoplanes sp. NPDC026623]|uniref:ribosomal maturation YjgA family protein n=1 Tax=Actinoplanes sp. NPDC026623 TaxID=3155610 RepID=UPI0033F07AB7
MPITHLRFRLLMLAAAGGLLAIAFAIRAGSGLLNGAGRLEQYSGTALYASMAYVGVLSLWPRRSPLTAGAIAWAWCWSIECFQLTGVPAYLSGHSLLARLALGVQFDPTDLLWYPLGIIPLAALHELLRRTTRTKIGRPRPAVKVDGPDNTGPRPS